MRKYIFYPLLTALSLLVAAGAVSAQESGSTQQMYENYSKLLSPEKVYLHTDKDVYSATDTIWISGYVENASYAAEFDESNYIYVELMNDQVVRNDGAANYTKAVKTVIARKKLRRFGNNFNGYIVVPEMNSTGRAILRGYTYWMLNRPVDYMFYKELELTNPMKDKLVDAMAEKNIKRKADYVRIGELSPEDKAKLERKEAKVEYDVQFLPESGNAVQGGKGVYYIKGIGHNGMGVGVYGEVSDADGNVLAEYVTDSLGFGKIVLAQVPAGVMTASVNDANGYTTRVKLPAALEEGVVINGAMGIVSAQEYGERDVLQFTVSTSASLIGRGLSAIMHNGSEIYYTKPITKVGERLSLKAAALNAGIHSISVVDLKGNVYAERPFVVLPSEKESLAVETQKGEYGRRELVNVTLTLPEEMADPTQNFSVAVTDSQMADNFEKTTIKSYMFLKSELQGYIEDIDFYFNDTVPLSQRMLRADYLMQTHGWRYYDLEKIIQGKNEVPHFGKEYSQTLLGKVVNMTGIANRAIVSFLAPSIGFKAMGQIDSGYFVLHDVNFPENTRFIISAVGKNGRSIRQTPELMKEYYAPVFNYPMRSGKVTYSDNYRSTVENIYYNNEDGEHAMAYELNPVVVTSQLITPKNSPSPIANYPIKREWYRDTMEMKAYAQNYSVGAYVAQAYSGVREFFGGVADDISVPSYEKGHLVDTTAESKGIPSGSLIGPKVSAGSMAGGEVTRPGRYGLVLVYLNGSYIPADEAVFTVLALPLSEVESMIYVSGVSAAPFQPSFDSGDVSPYPVLMVRTKPDSRGKSLPPNVSMDYPLGWQKPVKMYTPKYDSAEARKSSGRDSRITLYWNPSVQFDAEGKAYVSFYTSDSTSDLRIEIEGKSAAKQYHYVEKIIPRKK
ncbi:MAG: hypothetical protein J6Q34_00080 [Bacteroidales bacterium]|nr:hypothetical protein [Bacteroidales bacterium]